MQPKEGKGCKQDQKKEAKAQKGLEKREAARRREEKHDLGNNAKHARGAEPWSIARVARRGY